MEVEKLENLIYEWHTLTDAAIELKTIDSVQLQQLFQETYCVLEEFSKEEFVPKLVSKLLLEMNDFGWWVSDLDETPLHEWYQEIMSLISALNKYFFTRDYNVKAIGEAIERIAY